MPSSLAALAHATHDELGALRAETAPARGAERAGRFNLHIQILDHAAGSADEVVMRLGAGVPQGAGAAGSDPVRDSHFLE
jgi:hypothetical protein